MFLEILLATVIGILFGTFTGLIPGVHVNLIAVTMVSLSAMLIQYTSPLLLAVIIVAMAITHTFLSTIPSIFLGAPDSENVLSILPGHKLLLEGHGYEAVMLTILGSLGALLLSVVAIPILLEVIKYGYEFMSDFIGYILLVTVCFLLYKERKSKLWATIVFLLSGVLGVLVLTTNIVQEPLFPLLSGLFGTSSLILSYQSKTAIPTQQMHMPTLSSKEGIKAVSASVVVGATCSTLPGLGPAQAAIIASQFIRNITSKGFLVLVGGLSTVNMIASFVTLYIIDKARNGAVIAMSQLLDGLTKQDFLLFIAVSLITASIATILAIFLTKGFAAIMKKVSYKKVCIVVIGLIVILAVILSGIIGVGILSIATAVGLIPPLKNVGRNHLMGCLLIPVILFFLL